MRYLPRARRRPTAARRDRALRMGWPLGIAVIVLIRRKISRTDWELMSPEARYRVLSGPKIDHAAIRKTYESDKGSDYET